MQEPIYRTVVEEPSFEKDLDTLKKRYPNIYDVKDAICWELCRRQVEKDSLIPGETDIRIYNTYPIGDTPVFRVLYKYNIVNDPRMFLISIAPVNEAEE